MTDVEETIWHPADIFHPNSPHHRSHAIVILNQPLNLPFSVYQNLWSNSSYDIAADGGANRVYTLNQSNSSEEDLPLTTVIGDLDSLLPEAHSYWTSKNVPVIHDDDQYSTDFMKAVNYIRGKQDKGLDIVVLGGLGGRVDQGMSVLHQLYTYQKEPGYPEGKMYLLSTEAITFVLKAGRHKIKAMAKYGEDGLGAGLGKHVGIIPLKEPSIITTEGLEWDIKDWKTEFGGQMSTSNHVKKDWITVETTKDVLFTIDLELPAGQSSD
ncbi:thiamineeeeeeeeeeeeeeeeeeeeeeeeeeeeeeeeeeeeeeeeeeeeeeeeeeeeee pyrophosphokinase [Stipitochalara longipes BDJ]|nr:thiamineeeeeeeeeeeeeeeeeeeeeeeeeeeeeeeeeeeeeeeeeeeeeeeeeeeeee pyrophosphokinase [Stipitochalara longipes BDJ]